MNYDTGWEQNTTLKVGINGFGRIGRLVCRHILSISNCKVVSINALSKPEFLAYKFKYDTVHGTFKGDLSWDESNLYIDGNKIKVTNQRNPIDIHWEQSGAEYVCESTGFFTTTESAHQHILGGAKYVVITAPPKDNTPMFVMGVNHQKYIGQEVISRLDSYDKVARGLMGFECLNETTVTPVAGDKLISPDGKTVGKVTSSIKGASGQCIGLAVVARQWSEGSEVSILSSDKQQSARLVQRSFGRKG